MAAHKAFDKLVQNGLIKSPDKFSEADKQHLDKLSDDEVNALISIRSKLGDDFLQAKAAPSVAIVF